MFAYVKWRIFVAVLVLCAVLWGGTRVAEAAVRINEVAWMGTTASSTGEWIELVNDAPAPVALSGWRIEAEDGSPTIVLSGSIGANGYYLVERTTDATVPGMAADLVAPFGTGLSNAGETLNVKDAQGAVVDMVVGGNNWGNIGGNNTTKATAQRLLGVGGWTTGAPTPRAENIHPVTHVETVPTETLQVKTPAAPSKVQLLPESKKSITKKTSLLSQLKNTPANGSTTVLWKSSAANVGMSGFFVGRNMEWTFLLVGILLSVCAGIIIVQSGRREPTLAEEYSIVEDIIEGADD